MSQIQSRKPPEYPLSLALWNFASQWFLIPQGTGIVGLILYRLGYQFNGLHTIAKIVWIYTIVLLGLGLFFYILRMFVYPRHVCQQLRSSLVETSCLSSISIAFTSILQLASFMYGDHAGLPIYVLWWVNTALAIIACLGISYIQLKLQPPGIHDNFLPPSILLPFIAALTSAAGGGTICRTANISPRLQVPALIVSYLEVGVGLALAAAVDTLILYQLLRQIHPPPDKVYQDMILCGPFGQGSFALQILGEAVVTGSFAKYNRGTILTAAAAGPIGYTSQFLGLLVWGYGVFWWCLAILSICHMLGDKGWRALGFSLSTWSLIFPWGVFTNAAVEFSKIMNSPAFRVVSTGLLLLLLVMWIGVQALTVWGIITGRILGLDQGWRGKGKKAVSASASATDNHPRSAKEA